MLLVSEDYLKIRRSDLQEQAMLCLTQIQTATDPQDIEQITRRGSAVAARLDELNMLVWFVLHN
jgi:hypothetical protein